MGYITLLTIIVTSCDSWIVYTVVHDNNIPYKVCIVVYHVLQESHFNGVLQLSIVFN